MTQATPLASITVDQLVAGVVERLVVKPVEDVAD